VTSVGRSDCPRKCPSLGDGWEKPMGIIGGQGLLPPQPTLITISYQYEFSYFSPCFPRPFRVSGTPRPRTCRKSERICRKSGKGICAVDGWVCLMLQRSFGAGPFRARALLQGAEHFSLLIPKCWNGVTQQPFGCQAHWLRTGNLDLSRFCAAPSARLGHLPFECDRAFPAQC